MNVLVILFSSAAVFYLGNRFYARFIEKVFEVDGSHATPAVEINDGVDYVTGLFSAFSWWKGLW